MRTHISTATLIFALMLAMLTACFGPEPDTTGTDASRNATDTNEVTLGDPETQPPQEETLRNEQADANSNVNNDATDSSDSTDNAGNDTGNIADSSDAGNPTNDTDGSDTGGDAGRDARPGCDAGIDRTPDAGMPDSEPDAEPDAGTPDASPDAGPDAAPPAPTHIFETEEQGVLVEADEDTIASSADAPAWSTQAVASAEFTRPSGKTYTMLVYTRMSGEILADWMKRAEVGDAFISTRTIATSDGHTGYVYETNDMAAIPAVHVTVPTRNFVYYFQSDEESFAVPEDFLDFIRELELQ